MDIVFLLPRFTLTTPLRQFVVVVVVVVEVSLVAFEVLVFSLQSSKCSLSLLLRSTWNSYSLALSAD